MPVLGYVDEVIILPLGIWLVVRLIPDELMAEFREQAARRTGKPKSYAGAAAVALLWVAAAALVLWWLWPHSAG